MFLMWASNKGLKKASVFMPFWIILVKVELVWKRQGFFFSTLQSLVPLHYVEKCSDSVQVMPSTELSDLQSCQPNLVIPSQSHYLLIIWVLNKNDDPLFLSGQTRFLQDKRWIALNGLLSVLDHRRPGGDAEEGEGAGGGQEEAGADQTAAVQVSAQRAPRGQQLIRHSAEGGATVAKGAGAGACVFCNLWNCVGPGGTPEPGSTKPITCAAVVAAATRSL